MAYFPTEMPGVEPNMDDAGFWDGCTEKKLRFQCCGACGMLRHPPTPICHSCQSTNVRWEDAPEQAVVYTYTIVHHASHSAVSENLPYVVALVEFPALPGVRLVTNITDLPPTEVHIGMRVKLWWDDIGDGMFIPRFVQDKQEAG